MEDLDRKDKVLARIQSVVEKRGTDLSVLTKKKKEYAGNKRGPKQKTFSKDYFKSLEVKGDVIAFFDPSMNTLTDEEASRYVLKDDILVDAMWESLNWKVSESHTTHTPDYEVRCKQYLYTTVISLSLAYNHDMVVRHGKVRLMERYNLPATTIDALDAAIAAFGFIKCWRMGYSLPDDLPVYGMKAMVSRWMPSEECASLIDEDASAFDSVDYPNHVKVKKANGEVEFIEVDVKEIAGSKDLRFFAELGENDPKWRNGLSQEEFDKKYPTVENLPYSIERQSYQLYESWMNSFGRVNILNKPPQIKKNASLDSMLGGRVYSHYQCMPKAKRELIQIDGQKTVEVDYKNNHLRMVLSLIRGEIVGGDDDLYLGLMQHPFIVESGMDRKQVKLAVNAWLNAKNPIKVFIDRRACGNFRWDAGRFHDFQKAIFDQWPELKSVAGIGIGVGLQWIEGQIAVDVMHHMSRKDRVALNVHDSFIVREDDETEVFLAMILYWESNVQRLIDANILEEMCRQCREYSEDKSEHRRWVNKLKRAAQKAKNAVVGAVETLTGNLLPQNDGLTTPSGLATMGA